MTDRKPRTAKRKPTIQRRAWSRAVEEASIAMDKPLLDEALRNYEAIQDTALKLQLAREIAHTRGAELTLAYRNVVMVAYGYKRRTLGEKETLVRVPSVIFVVRRKWTPTTRKPDDAQHLPHRLLAYVTWEGRRMLVAVPTDVQLETSFAGARAQSDREICARSRTHAPEFGAVATLVDVRAAGETQRYGLTAMHVLTPAFDQTAGAPAAGVRIELAKGKPQPDGAPNIGTSLAIAGRLVQGPALSFDAQLFAIENPAEADRMLEGMPLSQVETYVSGPERLHQLAAADPPPALEILVADNHPDIKRLRPRLFATFSDGVLHTLPVSYSTPTGGLFSIQHYELVRLQCMDGAATIGGDSGSPVVAWTEDDRCTLLGMHIAAGDGGFAFIIPAWQLFHAGNYSGTLPADAVIGPVAAD
jgi:hypothetical protein